MPVSLTLALVALRQSLAAIPIPAGEFVMGAEDGDADERPVRRVHLRAYRIDRTEVTHAAYMECVAARRCRAPESGGDAPGPEVPVTGVSHRDARTYCRFVGGRLPREVEWEKAARGGDGRRYPWGADADCKRANFGNFKGSGPCPDNPGRPEKVGSRPTGASPYGVLDMAGNVWEWVADEYPGEPGMRVLRGGSCCGYFSFPRTTERLRFPPSYRDADIGFRCAYSLRPAKARKAGLGGRRASSETTAASQGSPRERRTGGRSRGRSTSEKGR